jgi:hypothetical protein
VKKVLAVFVLLIVAGYAWLQWGSSPSTVAAKADAKQEKEVANSALPPSAVFRIDPRKSGAPTGGAATTVASPRRGQLPGAVSPLMADYIARKDFPGLMTKVSALPNDAEALYLRAQLLERCAIRTDVPANAARRKTAEERRQTFVASLPPNHPDTPQRITAYDSANGDACGTLRQTETTGKEIAELLARAKELKDPVALARDVNCEIMGTADPTPGGARALEINDARAERIRQAIASRNPQAVRAGVGMLSNTYRNGAFRFGADGVPINQRAMSFVATILACQYGADCNAELQRACANEGHCGAGTFEDYLAFYQLSPSDAQLVEAYRTQLTQMIDRGDLSALQLIQADQPTESVRVGSYFSCPK